MTMPGPAANVFVADPKVVEVRPASASALFVFGVAPGRTTVAALNAAGAVLRQYTVTVQPSSFSSSEASASISRVLHDGKIRVDTTASGLTLTGQVSTPAEAEQAVTIARSYLPPNQVVDNRLSVASSVTVGLKVRIAEMSRDVTRQLGVNWTALGTFGTIDAFPALNLTYGAITATCASATGASIAAGLCKGASFQGVLNALSNDGFMRLLAEPTLMARSGEVATFLVGGEYPIPVSQQNNSISVDYKQYGVSLSFVPTVLSSGRISLHVRPEVSALTTAGAVTLSEGNSTLQIPALTVRRAETTIELGSGDTFVIAGLLQDNVTQSDTGIPGLSDIPILGALFSSDNFTRSQDELVIVVTPYIVNSIANPADVKLPTDGYVMPTDLERILFQRQQGAPGRLPPLVAGQPNSLTNSSQNPNVALTSPNPATMPRIPGSAGFILQ